MNDTYIHFLTGTITIEGKEYTLDEFFTALLRTVVETPDGPSMLGHWVLKNLEENKKKKLEVDENG